MQLLDSDTDIADDNEKHQSNSTEEQSKLDASENDLTTLFTEEGNAEEIMQTPSEINQTSESKDEVNAAADDVENITQPNCVEIGLKLAQRHFPESIFENCSTYNLTCPEVLREREDSSSSKEHFNDANNIFSDNISKAYSQTLYPSDDKRSENGEKVDDNSSLEDQVSLTDSFFADVDNNDDNVSQNSFFSRNTDCSPGSRKSSIISASKQNRISVFGEIKLDDDKLDLKSERKLSKKERKKQKRTKSKDAPMYECPKCGVCYILSENAPRNTARCLHCDLWKSVEPVFLKREKQPWNTCRIC